MLLLLHSVLLMSSAYWTVSLLQSNCTMTPSLFRMQSSLTRPGMTGPVLTSPLACLCHPSCHKPPATPPPHPPPNNWNHSESVWNIYRDLWYPGHVLSGKFCLTSFPGPLLPVHSSRRDLDTLSHQKPSGSPSLLCPLLEQLLVFLASSST